MHACWTLHYSPFLFPGSPIRPAYTPHGRRGLSWETAGLCVSALHDVNGDGHLDVVIGDLPGRVTVALGDGLTPMSFGAEKKMVGSNKEPLEFNNW